MENVKRLVKPQGHFMRNRGAQIALGLLIFVVGSLLLYDAFDARGRKIPWPASKLTPW